MNASFYIDGTGDGPYTCEIRQRHRLSIGGAQSSQITVIDIMTATGAVVLHAVVDHGQMVVRDLRVTPATERNG